MKILKRNTMYPLDKNYGDKIFRNKYDLERLIKLVKKGGYNSFQLAKLFKCNRTTVLGTLNRYNLHLKNCGEFKKRFYCNDKFFINLNYISAYWIGFIAADGNIDKKIRCLTIGLKKSDKTHLQKFLRAIKSTNKIRYNKVTNSFRIQLYSPNLCNSLNKYGIIPNKSLRINNVKIPYYLMSHFIRGVFDGDGYVGGNRVTHIQFQIVGFKPFLLQLQKVLIKKCKVNKTKIYKIKYSKATILQYTGSQIFKILNFIYKGSSNQNRLDRKYETYIKLKNKFKK